MAHSDQPLPVLRQNGSEPSDLVEGLGESLRPEDGGLVQLHRREVVRWAGHWFGRCSCGFVTTGCLSEVAAETEPCEVEVILAISRERQRQLLRSAA